MDKNDHGKVTTSLEAAIKQNPMYFKRVGDGYALTPDGLKEYKEMSEDLFLYETEFGKSDDSLYSMYGEQEMVDLFEALEACYEANPLDSVGLDSSSAVPQGTISDDELRSFIHEEEKAWALNRRGRAKFEELKSLAREQRQYYCKYGRGNLFAFRGGPLPDGVRCVYSDSRGLADAIILGYLDVRPQSKTFDNTHDLALFQSLRCFLPMDEMLAEFGQ